MTKRIVSPAPDGGWTYVIQARPDGPIKIGRTKDIHARLQSLAGSSPAELELLFLYPGMDLEKDLHENFSTWRLHGEWFTPEILAQHPALFGGLERRIDAAGRADNLEWQ